MAAREKVLSISTVFATVSLLLSLATLYFTNFAPPSVATVAGPNIKVYYPPDGGFGLYLPVAFVNTSAATGMVYRVGVSITPKQPGADTFYFEWRYFTIWGDQRKIAEPSHALAVQGNSALDKILWLTWHSNSEPRLVLQPGEYLLAVHVWKTPTGKPETQYHDLIVDDETYKTLEDERGSERGGIVDMSLERGLPPNRHLGPEDAKSLLGLKQN